MIFLYKKKKIFEWSRMWKEWALCAVRVKKTFRQDIFRWEKNYYEDEDDDDDKMYFI